MAINPSVRIPEPKDRVLDDLYIELSKKYRKEGADEFVEDLIMFADLSECVILDVACGCGEFAYALARQTSQKVIGVDINHRAVQIARNKSRKASNLEFRVGDVYNLAENFSNVGLVTVIQSLHHFDDLDKALDHLVAVLSPNGRIFIQDFDRYRAASQIVDLVGLPRPTMDEIYGIITSYPEEKAVAILKEKGLLKNSKIPTYFSFLAAYTALEVAEKLKARGFGSMIAYQDEIATYAIIAGRVSSRTGMIRSAIRRVRGYLSGTTK